MKMAEVRKKRPPKLQKAAATIASFSLNRLSSQRNVPSKYMSPPIPANRSTQKPLSSYWMHCFQVFPFSLRTRYNFQVWEMMMKDEPIQNWSYPICIWLTSGMKQAEPVRQRREPRTETKKLTLKLVYLQQGVVQCFHSMMSARRKVAEPRVQSHAETEATLRQGLKKGKRMMEPRKKVEPPKKQLKPCQVLHNLELSVVDFGCSILDMRLVWIYMILNNGL